uniref:Uncharacterized protein n=1 Tax=Myotis myotis TaxID=51298 RepID=A0A7J7Z4I9_MYOMY|nr:hypothetical protein mMyoMyo1_010445 [Myotis myotis]
MLCYSDVVPHELKGPNHARKTCPKPYHCPHQLEGLYSCIWGACFHAVSAKFSLCHQHNATGNVFIGPHDFFPMLECPILVFLCELETFYLGNCRQQWCSNRPLASISHMMQCMANLPTNIRWS